MDSDRVKDTNYVTNLELVEITELANAGQATYQDSGCLLCPKVYEKKPRVSTDSNITASLLTPDSSLIC
jgi:hypothetical protein